MSNYASLLAPLTFSGSRLSDGTPNATGNLHVYLPGTTTPTNVYADPAATILATQPIVLDNGGRIPVATYANGLYVTSPVRIVVKDVTDSVVITDVTSVPASAGNVGVNNSGWTGTTVDAVLTAIYASVGGQDGRYLEHPGETSRLIQDKFRELQVSVKDCGAVGDGITDDTTACQTAINRVIALGGGVVYFPPGTYKISLALTVTSATGLVMVGAGQGSSVIHQASASTHAVDFATGTTVGMRDLHFDADVTWTTCNGVFIDRVTVISSGNGMAFTGTSGIALCQKVSVTNSTLSGRTNGALMSFASVVTYVNCTVTDGGGSTNAFRFQNSVSQFTAEACNVSATKGALFDSGVTGGPFVFSDGPSLALSTTTPIDATALSSDPYIIVSNCGMESLTLTAPADGSTQTHVNILYASNVVRVTSGVGTAILGTPALTPFRNGKEFVVVFWNNSSGDIVWSLNAIWHAASSISGTNNNITCVTWRWDGTNSCFREMSRAVTT